MNPKKRKSSTTSKKRPADGRDVKGDKRWEVPERMPLADFFHLWPAHAIGIEELRGPRLLAFAHAIAATDREGVLIIHRNLCRLGKSTNARGECDCSPTYLTMGACA